ATLGNPAATANTQVGTNEVQTVTLGGTSLGGTFTLTFNGQTTAPIAFNAPATGVGSVQSALAALSTIGSTANVNVLGTTRASGATYVVIFTGARAGPALPQLYANGAGLTGTTPTATAATAGQGAGRPVTTVQQGDAAPSTGESLAATGGTFVLS